jgi:hypothetical protein
VTSSETAESNADALLAAHYTWLRRLGIDLPTDVGHDRVIFLDQKILCGATHQKVRLRCWDLTTRALKLTFERPHTYADAPQLHTVEATNGGLRLGYQFGKNLIWYEIDTATGRSWI